MDRWMDDAEETRNDYRKQKHLPEQKKTQDAENYDSKKHPNENVNKTKEYHPNTDPVLKCLALTLLMPPFLKIERAG